MEYNRRKSKRTKKAVLRYSDEIIDVSFLKKRIRSEEQSRKRRLTKNSKERKKKIKQEFHQRDPAFHTHGNSSRRRLACFSPEPLSDDNEENFAPSQQTPSNLFNRRVRLVNCHIQRYYLQF